MISPLRPILFVVLLAAIALAHAVAPTPPVQPAHGPGSAEYAHAQVIAHEVKSGAQGWWLFVPSSPRPASAPVVVFCHGWGALDPKGYRAWIDHIVRRGNIVIWPNYQASLLTPGGDFLHLGRDARPPGQSSTSPHWFRSPCSLEQLQSCPSCWDGCGSGIRTCLPSRTSCPR